MTVTEHTAPAPRSAPRGTPGPDQVTIRSGESPATGSARPVNDTVHNETPQAAAPLTPEAQENTRVEWR